MVANSCHSLLTRLGGTLLILDGSPPPGLGPCAPRSRPASFGVRLWPSYQPIVAADQHLNRDRDPYLDRDVDPHKEARW